MQTTSTIPIKLIILGIFATGLILYYGATVGTRPTSTVKPRTVTKTDYVKIIYCGVPIGNNNYNSIASGIILPLGGKGTLEGLRDGDHNCNYTMWFSDAWFAYQEATETVNGPKPGYLVLKKADISGSQFIDVKHLRGGDLWNESPIFIKGAMSGCITVLVQPGMDKNMLINFLSKAL